MRYSREHKTKTRNRIIQSAHRLFTTKGYAATSIDEIMHECGLTRGGFYAHFKSKSELYHEAISYAASRELSDRLAATAHDDGWIGSILDEFLDSRRTGGDHASRLAFFATDAASRESEVRSAYTKAFKSVNEIILQRTAAHTCSEDAILSTTAMIIGALVIAQTTDDLALRSKLLAACKENAKTLLGESSPYPRLNFFWSGNDNRRFIYDNDTPSSAPV